MSIDQQHQCQIDAWSLGMARALRRCEWKRLHRKPFVPGCSHGQVTRKRGVHCPIAAICAGYPGKRYYGVRHQDARVEHHNLNHA